MRPVSLYLTAVLTASLAVAEPVHEIPRPPELANFVRNDPDEHRITFRLSNEERFAGKVDHFEKLDPEGEGWAGHLDDSSGSFVIIQFRGYRSARIHTAGRTYEIEPAGGGSSFKLTEFDTTRVPQCRTGVRRPATRPVGSVLSASAAAACAFPHPCDDVIGAFWDLPLTACTSTPPPIVTTPVRIRVLILYTDDVASGHTAGGLLFRILMTIFETNIAFVDSQVAIRLILSAVPGETRLGPFRLPYVICGGRVEYAETRNYRCDLNRLRRNHPEESLLNEAHGFRDTCCADVVFLLVKELEPGIAGLSCILPAPDPAYEPFAFSVVHAESAWSHFSLAHEMGHMLGGGHDAADGQPGMCTSSRGFTFTHDGTHFGTIMAMTPNRIRYFSNPSVSYGGLPLGSATANNAQTFNMTGPIVAGLR